MTEMSRSFKNVERRRQIKGKSRRGYEKEARTHLSCGGLCELFSIHIVGNVWYLQRAILCDDVW
jgi:hypothetical protein